MPVVPVALKTDFQGNGKIFKDMGPVDPTKTLYIKFGKPELVEGKAQDMHRRVIAFILQNLRAWGAQVDSDLS